ncbi:MAG: hypothetical protein ACR2KK_04925 [Acidimicrobiales bacterium]
MAVETMSKPDLDSQALLTCPRDRSATRLTCIRCGTPICPSCLVRTAVGLSCVGCAAPQPSRRVNRGARIAVAVAMAVFSVAYGWQALGRSTTTSEEVVAVEVAPAPARTAMGQQVTVGRFAVTLTGFDCGGHPNGRPEAQRCTARLDVRNDSLQSLTFPAGLSRVTNGSRRYVPDAASVSQAVAPVNPGEAVDMVIDFDLPATFDASRLELRSSPRERPVRIALYS